MCVCVCMCVCGACVCIYTYRHIYRLASHLGNRARANGVGQFGFVSPRYIHRTLHQRTQLLSIPPASLPSLQNKEKQEKI